MNNHEWKCTCAECLAEDVRYGDKAPKWETHAPSQMAIRMGVLGAELLATRKAKAENDERFQIERDEARRERDEAARWIRAACDGTRAELRVPLLPPAWVAAELPRRKP